MRRPTPILHLHVPRTRTMHTPSQSSAITSLVNLEPRCVAPLLPPAFVRILQFGGISGPRRLHTETDPQLLADDGSSPETLRNKGMSLLSGPPTHPRSRSRVSYLTSHVSFDREFQN